MAGITLLVLLIGLASIFWQLARARAVQFRRAVRFGSLPAQHGWTVALWAVLPALALLVVWQIAAPALVTDAVLRTPAAADLPPPGFARATLLSQARALATGHGAESVEPLSRRLAPAYAAATRRSHWIATVAVLALAIGAGAAALARVRAGTPARTRVERLVTALLFAASLVAILTTAGILFSLVWESGRFFATVPAQRFLFGTHWSPQSIVDDAPGDVLGALPLFWGTFFIGAVIAMAVAVPLGLLSAIYLSQYAAGSTRRLLKPALEVLAGVPTVVYGYFGALTVAPAVRRLGMALGMADASSESAMAAGLVMGVMILPFVSSIADDSLIAVPVELGEASLALGATTSETVRQVLLPAALPGVAGGVLLAISRAVGETMIVVMVASAVATLSVNPFASATTVTRQIIDLLTGEATFDSPKTLAAFALGLTLFVVTLALNIAALALVRRHRVRGG
ncbi:phosphate ABC transporter membrane protein 1, PhoT family [Sphingomonas gellani]|uniref:Phosphate transport system permease protein n=1 Tax=Sphingomonas gellani TaxID=1166340 RepID=A0A1H8FX46_9SPHN|nr:phosphate ABC transporter permease subunit PstC [Sphingomonas gellani]SEN36114.1 phosphate ABC transporter membrane protein 1, PhoT family [Sphingomonas gellani]